MPVNITDANTFTDPIVAPADSDPADRTYVITIAQGLANRTRNLHNRVGDIEDHITSQDEWGYPPNPGSSFKTRTIEVLPTAFTPAGTTANNIPWRWNSAQGRAETTKTASGQRAEGSLQLNRLVPGNAVITAIRVLVTPGAGRSAPNKLAASLYSREPSTYTGTEAVGSVALAESTEDDGGTSLQSLVLSNGADMTLGFAIWLTVVSGSGDTDDDFFHGVQITFQDYGPINI